MRPQYFVVLMLNLGSSCFVLSLCSWEANSLTTKYVSAWRGIELETSGLKDMSCLQNKEGTFRNNVFLTGVMCGGVSLGEEAENQLTKG